MQTSATSLAEHPARPEGSFLDGTERFTKTLFIILDAGTAIRNILRTDVFRLLREQNWLRIVIFSPINDAEFKAEFESHNVIVEPIQFWRPTALVKMLRSVRKDVWIEQFHLSRFKEKRTNKVRLLNRLVTDFLLRKADPDKIKA